MGQRVSEGWRGSGSGKNGNAGSSCSGRAATLQAACHSGTAPRHLDMSLAGKVSCSMLNCFVSPHFYFGIWLLFFIFNIKTLPSLPRLLVCRPANQWGVVMLVDPRERCSY